MPRSSLEIGVSPYQAGNICWVVPSVFASALQCKMLHVYTHRDICTHTYTHTHTHTYTVTHTHVNKQTNNAIKQAHMNTQGHHIHTQSGMFTGGHLLVLHIYKHTTHAQIAQSPVSCGGQISLVAFDPLVIIHSPLNRKYLKICGISSYEGPVAGIQVY